MTDSAVSPIVTGTSPAAPAPNPPVIDSVTFNKLVASVAVTLSLTEVDGEPLAALSNIKIKFGPQGSDLSGVAPLEFPGNYPPGSQQTVQVTVPAYATPYDFEAIESS